MITIKRKPHFPKNFYEKEYWENSQLVCGIDEVGRSSIAGPVVAAAVILKTKIKSRLIKDSKLLTAEQRLEAYKWLEKNSVFAVGIIHHRIIDKVNIYYATLKAMKRALFQLLAKEIDKPDVILIDAMPLEIPLDIPVVCFCYGERQSISIAAASIIAKVTRDKLMERMDTYFPNYHIFTNKGYGTPIHRKNIGKEGLLIIHRINFLKFFFNISQI